MEPVTLPDQFNQTINNQFCFILQSDSGNDSLNVQALNDFDLSNITQDNGNAVLMNATGNVKQYTWYKVSETISSTQISANLYDANDTLIGNTITPNNNTNSNQLVMLVTNNVNSAVVLKDLTLQETNSDNDQPVPTLQPSKSNDWFDSPLFLTILLAATLTATMIYIVKSRKKPDYT